MNNNYKTLEDLLELFKGTLKTEGLRKNYIPKVDAFLKILREFKPDIDNSDKMIHILETEITDDILKNVSINYLIKYEQPSEQLLNGFITAISEFFRKMNGLHIVYNNYVLNILATNTSDKFSVQELKKDIKKKLLTDKEIELLPKEKDPSIIKEEFEFIVDWCDNKISLDISNSNKDGFKLLRDIVSIKLVLFTGMSFDKLVKLSVNCFDREYKLFSTEYISDESAEEEFKYCVHLPRNLSKQLDSYIRLRNKASKEKSIDDSGYLFVKDTCERILNTEKSDIHKLLKCIEKDYMSSIKNLSQEKDSAKGKRSSFTPTGIAKYCIIEMIKKGINQSIIQDFTGYGDIVYNDCQQNVNATQKENKNRYIDSKLRSLEMFDKL